ncbi:T-cell-specific surface glycoprotein CD28 isoform X2 [Spea bombifrons]|uniref:T-cell-specific surface glycoprotein CD28 isoform X2 n=1 Tax=Spea bombifrons TaxID=233779 RepID=UPI00234BB0C5|nr:T-cell-specific surface glycoprotein CD28 isoform X2 [Spea bombifrons]
MHGHKFHILTMILWMALSISFILFTQSIDTERSNNYVVVDGKINLTFHCNVSEAKEVFKVALKKGLSKKKTICEGSFNSSHLPFQHHNCWVTPTESSVTFSLWDLTENDTDIYYFHKEEMYPPPYTSNDDNGTIIRVKENVLPKSIPVQLLSPWPMLATVVLAVYSTCITVAFFYVLKKERKTRISQSEYINVVPRWPKHHQQCIPAPKHSQAH